MKVVCSHKINKKKQLPLAASIFLLVFCSTNAFAGELSLLLNGRSIHIENPPAANFNEANWGVGLQYDWNRPEHYWQPFLSASWFLDSSNQTSYYAGGGYLRRWQLGSRWHAEAGWIAFLMSLKDFDNGQLFAGALPMLSIGTDRVSVNATYVPRVHPEIVELVFFQLKIKLD